MTKREALYKRLFSIFLSLACVLSSFGATVVAQGPWYLKSDTWKPGVYEWKGLGKVITPSITNWSGYDRVSVDLVNEGAGGNRVYMFLASPGTPHPEKFVVNTGAPGHRFRRWVIPLSKLPSAVSISNITQIVFSSKKGTDLRLHISNVRLLKKGESSGGGTFKEAPADNPAMRDIVRRTVDERSKERSAVHTLALDRFMRTCTEAGTVQNGVAFGWASSMKRVMPRDDFSAEPAKTLMLSLARNEKESVQLVLASRGRDLSDVRLRVPDLVSRSGVVLASSNVVCSVTGYSEMCVAPDYSYWTTVKSSSNTLCRVSSRPILGWYPEALLDFLESVDIRNGDVQSFWLRVRCPNGQPAGVYRGSVSVSWKDASGKRYSRNIPLGVRVYDFTLPLTPPVPMNISFKPTTRSESVSEDGIAGNYYENERRISRDPENSANLARKKTREWAQFLADNLITIDYLYPSVGPRWQELVELKKQGRLDRFNLLYWNQNSNVAEGSAFLAEASRRYQKAKELGLLENAVFYGMDEIRPKHFEKARGVIDAFKRLFPEVPLVTTAVDSSYGCSSPLAKINEFIPVTVSYKPEQAEKARSQGRRVGWYICAGSDEIRPEFFFAHDIIESRHLMGATAVKYRPDSFLYYEIALWDSDRPITSGPFTEWSPESYYFTSGDGNLTACGPGGKPLSTVRLENFRDGLEDYHYAKILEKRLADKPDAPWAGKARMLLAVPDEVVTSLVAFTVEPDVYQRWRDALAKTIEESK